MKFSRWARRMALIAGLWCLIWGALHTQAAAPSAWQSLLLSRNLPATSTIEHVPAPQISPDGRYALYLADGNLPNVFDLYSVATDGLHDPVQITSLAAQSRVGQFAISRDSQTVIYSVLRLDSADTRLYSQPIGGGPATQLDMSTTPEEDFFFVLSPDAHTVVYKKLFTDALVGLMSTPISTSQPLSLTGSLNLGPNSVLEISPDSLSIFFTANASGSDLIGLYRTPIASASPTLIAQARNSLEGFHSLIFTRAGHTAVYERSGNGASALYSVPLTGTTPLTLTEALISSFQLTPNGQQIVMLAKLDDQTPIGLYSLALSGGAPIQLDPNDSANPNYDFVITPDSQHVVFYTREITPGTALIYSNTISGTNLIPLSNTSSDVFIIDVDASGQYVLYTDFLNSNFRRIFSARIDGTNTQQLSAEPTGDAVVSVPIFDVDGETVVYPSGSAASGLTQLQRVPISGGTSEVIVPALPSGQRIITYMAVRPNRYVYVQRDAVSGIDRLYAVLPPQQRLYLPLLAR